ncbi:hypothetical protein Tco_1451106 [Tanacetum coccineum]
MLVKYSIELRDDVFDTPPSGTAPTLPCSYCKEYGETLGNVCGDATTMDVVLEQEFVDDLDIAKTNLVLVAVLLP